MRVFLGIALGVILGVSTATPYNHCTGRKNGVQLPNILDCKSYYVCSHGRAEQFECKDGLMYDYTLGVCNWPENVTCASAVIGFDPPTHPTTGRPIILTPLPSAAPTMTPPTRPSAAPTMTLPTKPSSAPTVPSAAPTVTLPTVPTAAPTMTLPTIKPTMTQPTIPPVTTRFPHTLPGIPEFEGVEGVPEYDYESPSHYVEIIGKPEFVNQPHSTSAPQTPPVPTTGYPTTGYPTTSYPTTGYPTTGYPTTGYPTTGNPTTGYPTTGYPTTGYPTTWPPSWTFSTPAPTWIPSSTGQSTIPPILIPSTPAPTMPAPTPPPTPAPTTAAPITSPPINIVSTTNPPFDYDMEYYPGVIRSPVDPESFTCANAGLYFAPHPTSCQIYFICENFKLHRHQCGPGVFWDYIFSQCVYAETAFCFGNDHLDTKSTIGVTGPIAIGTISPPTQPPSYPEIVADPIVDCPGNQAFFAHKTDCRKYYICIGGIPIATSCPEKMAWDDEHLQCSEDAEAQCVTQLMKG